MNIIATVSDMTRVAVVVDLKYGQTIDIPMRPEFIDSSIETRPRFRPFGITWSRDELYIVNNRQLLVFDRRLEFLRTLPTRMQVNVHQLAYKRRCVWAVSPWTNSLIGVSRDPRVKPVEFDLLSGSISPYIERDAGEHEDIWHFNSLLWADGYLFVAAHAFGRLSFINCYDAKTMTLSNVQQDVGSSIHGLARHKRQLFWISTKTGEIRSDSGYRIVLTKPGYARGFAVSRRHFIVGISEFLARGKRHIGDSWIQVLDRGQGVVMMEIRLPDTGSINDLRLLDEYDYAHNVDPFWA